ncbi:hypothetical protein XO12_09280 [Marinitoga sp. 1154]|uniref:DUF1819 family protein n=1 Tax=Marinitoga sp. 1154 TaxID=1643335 RepID=UPI0015868B44|nr:DUF1819 family protein [Marinitoga sp. 1154]NUV00273.1 hypothetical protein [Marinitoga sp. 1154]
MKYTTLSGDRSLLRELKIMIELLNQNFSMDEIKKKVFEENLFQYSSTASTQRVFTALKKRLKYIDKELVQIFISTSYDTKRAINLYLIMKSNKLMFDFMFEIIREKYLYKNFKLNDFEINNFFEEKKIQISEISNWSEKTLRRTKTEIKKILYDSGIIKDKKTMEIQYILIDDSFKKYIISKNEEIFLECMGVLFR